MPRHPCTWRGRRTREALKVIHACRGSAIHVAQCTSATQAPLHCQLPIGHAMWRVHQTFCAAHRPISNALVGSANPAVLLFSQLAMQCGESTEPFALPNTPQVTHVAGVFLSLSAAPHPHGLYHTSTKHVAGQRTLWRDLGSTASSSRCGICSLLRYTPALLQKMYCSKFGNASMMGSVSTASRPFRSYTTAGRAETRLLSFPTPLAHSQVSSVSYTTAGRAEIRLLSLPTPLAHSPVSSVSYTNCRPRRNTLTFFANPPCSLPSQLCIVHH